MRRRVLVVARELGRRAKIARTLQSAGYAVELAEDRDRALDLAAHARIEAAVVASGSDPVCSAIARELRGIVPRMIVLADPKGEVFRPARFLSPADPILLGPVDEKELLALLIPETASPEGAGDEIGPVMCFEGRKLDLAGRAFVHVDGREAPLTGAESALLAAFIRNPFRVLSRDQLSRAALGRGAEAFDRNIDVLVGRLRRKIEPDPKTPRFILTVTGAGYKFAARPHSAAGSESQFRATDSEGRSEDEPRSIDRLGSSRVAPANATVAGVVAEPERRQVTVLSCGLAGITVSAVNSDLEDVGRAIRLFQEACAGVIAHMGGSVTRVSYDEILGLFGYPQAGEDDAERAVHAGFDLIPRVGQLRTPSGQPLQMQIGIATGPVLVGGEEAITGEPLDFAVRLRIAAPLNSMIVTAGTRKLLGGAFVCENFRLDELGGVSERVAAFRVTGRRAVKSRFDARRTEKITRLVGRQHELRQLWSLWKRAKGGKGRVALLCGEAGIGKSRICEALLDRLAEEPHIAIHYQCSPHYANSPFHPIIRQLEQVARFEPEDTTDVKLGKLEGVLSDAGAATLVDAAFYATLLSIPTDGHYPLPGLAPQRQKDLTIAALIRQVLGLARRQPLIIKLADAHWIDSSTLEFLDRLIASITSAPVFVLISFRPEFFPHWLDQSHVSMLRLDRLRRDQAEAIVIDVAGGKEIPPEICEQIICKSDGVPLFVEELTTAALESGQLQLVGGRYVTVGSLPPLMIPTTLADSLTARLDRLGPAKEIAQIGAAIGREFSYRLLAAVAPTSGPSLLAALAQLTGPELIFARGEPPNSTYIFKHALVQDASYATLPRSKLEHLHRRIAFALEEGFPEIAQTQPELIAHHFEQAGLTERAVDYLRRAGRRAIDQSANAEAIRHLTHALELWRSLPESPERARAALELEVMLGQATIANRGYAAPETKEVLLRARMLIDDLTDPSQKFAILYGLWACSYVGGVFHEHRAAAADLLVEAERHDDAGALCLAHRALGTTCVTTGNFVPGLRYLERARALYEPQRHVRLRHQYGQDIGAAALCYLSWALWHLGYVDQAAQVADEAVRHAQELSHPHTVVYTICHARGFMDIFRRRADDMQSYAELVVSLCNEHGFSHWINCGRIFQGWAAICRGEIGPGIEVLRAGVAGWRGTGSRLWLPAFLALEAEAYAKAGRNDNALQAIDQALAVLEETGECWAKAEALRMKAGLLMATGRAAVDEVETLLVTSLGLARRQQARSFALRTACDLARIRQGQDRRSEAMPLLQSIYGRFTEGFGTLDLQCAKALIENLRLDTVRA
jgi:DNA-binding response OmpR family regulator/class 3 adenylate cyclase/predicted ATPase